MFSASSVLTAMKNLIFWIYERERQANFCMIILSLILSF